MASYDAFASLQCYIQIRHLKLDYRRISKMTVGELVGYLICEFNAHSPTRRSAGGMLMADGRAASTMSSQ